MKWPSSKVIVFQEKYLPQNTSLIGTAALVQALDVKAPVRFPACVSENRFKESVRESDLWRIYDSKYQVEPTWQGHLVFAIKHEYMDLLVLKRVFLALPEKEVAEYVRSAPTGPVVRRIWFLYEFLTGKTLKVPDAGKVAAVDLLDEGKYFVREGTMSSRHKVRNNLLGTAHFCPIVRRTEKLESFVASDLPARAKSIIAKVSPQLIARAASFLLLADSQASFAIEGERLPAKAAERWLRAVQQVGNHQLTTEELDRLHSILIGEFRFMEPGFRKEGVFLGTRTMNNEPIPEFIGARPQDIEPLITGLLETNEILRTSPVDAVLQATATAFGFVYVHPYEDGNGRMHRCLIHNALAEKKFSPPAMVFPVSSVMLKWIDQYRQVLQQHTAPLMPFIDWVPTTKGNVDVKNDTSDLYRYFDCTSAAEFLYQCVQETIDNEIPTELDYLKRHDRAMREVKDVVEMPDRLIENFIMFMRQNDWKLSKRRREGEFEKLTDREVKELEAIVQEAFEGFPA